MRLLQDPGYLSATIGAIYDCALDPTRWATVMGELAGLLGASRAFLGVATPTGETPTIVAAPGYTPEDFTAPEMALNPILPLGLTYPLDAAFVGSRDYGMPQLQATRFYREYLAPRDMLDAIAFLVTREGNAIGHWFIATPPRHGPITAEEAAGLTLIAPHLRRAVEISRVLGVQRLEAETCSAALRKLDSPVLVLAVEHDKMMVDRLEHAAIAQPDEPAIDRAPGREGVGQQAPSAARPQHVEGGVGDLAQRPGSPPTAPGRAGQQRFQDPPFGVGQVTRIAQARAAMLPPGGRGPHRVVRPRCRNPVESRCSPAIQPTQAHIGRVSRQPLRKSASALTVPIGPTPPSAAGTPAGGIAVGSSEAEPFWLDFLRSLERRALAGVKLVVSDAHEGLEAAVTKVLRATWQRC